MRILLLRILFYQGGRKRKEYINLVVHSVRLAAAATEVDETKPLQVNSLQTRENCTITSSEIEAVCCNDRPEIMELLPEPGHCVTHLDFFRQQLMSDDSLTYNRLILASTIKSETARQQYLSKEFTNRLKRHLAYRTYLVIVNNSCPLGRYNRVVIPRCVVSKIREKYPEVSDSLYTGFIDVQNNAAQSASSTTE